MSIRFHGRYVDLRLQNLKPQSTSTEDPANVLDSEKALKSETCTRGDPPVFGIKGTVLGTAHQSRGRN